MVTEEYSLHIQNGTPHALTDPFNLTIEYGECMEM